MRILRPMISDELRIARDAFFAGKAGRCRTAARRAVGNALQETLGIGPRGGYAKDYIAGVKRLAEDTQMPEAVRAAALRLATRVDRDYNSPSVNPVADAETIIAHLLPGMVSLE